MSKRKLTGRIVLFVVILAVISCGRSNSKTEKEESQLTASVIEVSIGGMTCTGCEQTITKNVSKLDGVKSVKANFTTGTAVVEYYPTKTDTLKMKEAVIGSGYTVKKFTAVNP